VRTRWTWGFREDTPYTLTRRAEGPNVVFEIDGRSRWRRVDYRYGYYYPTWHWVVTPFTWAGTLCGRAFEERVAKAAGQAERLLALLRAGDDEAKRAHEEAKRVAGLVGDDGGEGKP